MLTTRAVKLGRSIKTITRLSSWAEIKCALEQKGHTLASLARKHQVSRQAFAKVKDSPSAPVQEAIAKALGEKPEEIWPNRYGKAA
jgi:Ner family transcriptional regulator